MAGLGLTVLAALLAAGSAHARTEILRWTHDRPSDVTRWEAYVGDAPGDSATVSTLPTPTLDQSGVFESTVDVPDSATVYIALRAVGPNGTRSGWSNERSRVPQSGGGGTSPIGSGTTIPPVSGALERADFTGSAVGNAISGWVDTGANFSTATNDALFAVADLGGNRVLTTTSTLADVHSHLTGTSRTFSNLRLSGRMAVGDANGAAGVTAYSAFPTGTNYYRLGRGPGGSFRIEGRPGLTCASADTGVVPDPNVWYVFQLTVTSEATQNRIQAKIWEQGTPEPNGLQAECTDASTSRRADGTIGVWSSGAGQKYWDDLEVTSTSGSGSGGDTVAPPILIQIVPVTP